MTFPDRRGSPFRALSAALALTAAALCFGGFGPISQAVAATGPHTSPPPVIFYAAPSDQGTADCSTPADACTLNAALSEVTPGEAIELTTPGTEGESSTYYEGPFTLSETESSLDAITIEPMPGIGTPILDGNGSSTVLTLTNSAPVDLSDLTIQNGNGNHGGAIADNNGTTLTVADCTFLRNHATRGGAIDDGDRIVWGGTITVTGSTFTGNSAETNGGAIDNGDENGEGELSVTDSVFTDNVVHTGDGGAIDSSDGGGTGQLQITGSTFSRNEDDAVANGGAINSGSGDLGVEDTTFSENTTGGDGGAIDGNDGVATGWVDIQDSTFSSNSATHGGAIDSNDGDGEGSLFIVDTTLSSNDAVDGGAIDSADGGTTGDASVYFSTFSDNRSTARGGAINGGDTASNSLTVNISTFAGNASDSPGDGDAIDAGGDVSVEADIFTSPCRQRQSNGVGAWMDVGYNVGSDASCFSGGPGDTDTAGPNLVNLLGPLTDNGGPTPTMALLPTNPAISLLPESMVGGCDVVMDQRGVPAVSGQNCDAGAVQLAGQGITFTSSVPTGSFAGTYPLSATGGPSGLPITFSSDAPGICSVSGSAVTLLSSGTCSVTANQAGNVNFLAAQPVTQSFAVATVPPLVITSNPALPSAREGTPYVANLTTEGGNGSPNTWSLVSGSLPPGLTLNPSGAISGTPTSPGSYSFGLTVGDPVTQAFTLSVAAPVTAAILTAAPASPAHASVALALTGADLPPLLRSGGALIMTGILILTLSAVLRRRQKRLLQQAFRPAR